MILLYKSLGERMKVAIVVMALVLLLVVQKGRYHNEIIVRTITNLEKMEDVESLVMHAKEHNISIISIAFKQDEDDEVRSGEVFYHSAIAPIVKGYEKEDILEALISKAHEEGIMIKAWIPQFHDQVAFSKNPDWGMISYHDSKSVSVHKKSGEYFVNPLHHEVQKYELSLIEEIVSMYDIDGVVLDWIRFDGYNMDLSAYTRKKYLKRFGYDPIMIDFSKKSAKRREWNRYRTQELASYIKKVSSVIKKIKPEIDLGVYILSPAWKEVGQDPTLFAKDIDFLSPMCYYDDWGYPIEWIYGPRDDAILVATKRSAKEKEIVPVFDTDWDKKSYDAIFTNLKKSYPQIKTVAWFAYGEWSEEKLHTIPQDTNLSLIEKGSALLLQSAWKFYSNVSED